MDKNNTAYRYLLALLNISFGNKDHLSETFLRNTHIFSMNLNFYMTLKTVSKPLTYSKFLFKIFVS